MPRFRCFCGSRVSRFFICFFFLVRLLLLHLVAAGALLSVHAVCCISCMEMCTFSFICIRQGRPHGCAELAFLLCPPRRDCSTPGRLFFACFCCCCCSTMRSSKSNSSRRYTYTHTICVLANGSECLRAVVSKEVIDCKSPTSHVCCAPNDI